MVTSDPHDLPRPIRMYRRMKGLTIRPYWTFKATFTRGGQVVFECRQRQHLYRLFVDIASPYKPVWVGRFFAQQDIAGWYTVERELSATHLSLNDGEGPDIILFPKGVL